jgi:hypothetical protein
MSDLRTRETRRPASAGARPVRIPVAALTTAGWAAVVGSAPVLAVALIAWIADTRSGAPAYDAVRIAFNGWLLAHGTWLRTAAGPIGLAPLALSILVFRQLMRAGTNSARATGAASIPAGVRVVGWITLVYSLLGMLVAFLAGTPDVNAHLGVAALATGVFAFVASTAGVLRANGLGALVAGRLPAPLARALPCGALAAGLVLGSGALLAGTCVALSAEQAGQFFDAFTPGAVGSTALFGLSVLYTPTAAVWGATYVVGPGFAVGSGTSVSALDVSLGPLPAFPLLAGLPADRASTVLLAVLGIPLVAGVLAGVAAARRRNDGERWAATLLGAALAGPVAGALLGAAAYAAGGPLGGGRLAAVGPSAWRVALVLAVEVTLFAVVGAALARILHSLPGVWLDRVVGPIADEPVEPVVEPADVDQPAVVEEPAVVDEPAVVAEPAVVDEPGKPEPEPEPEPEPAAQPER